MADHTTLRYMNEFACIADKCSDTCCAGWRVLVEESHYHRFAANLREEGKNPDDYMKRLGPNNSGSFASVRHDERGGCMFLAPEGLCSIHSKDGEKALPQVCQTYPRKYLVVGQRIEAAGMLSCPEVARLAVLSDDLVLPTTYRPALTDKQRARILAKPKTPESAHFELIRSFGLELLLTPRMTGPKLFILGYFAHKLEELVAGRPSISAVEVTRLIKQFQQADYQDGLEEQFDIVYQEPGKPIGMSILQSMIANSFQIAPTKRIALNAERAWTSYGVTEKFVIGDGKEVRPVTLKLDFIKLWETYQERRARIEASFVVELDLYCRNLVIHNWLTQPFTEYPSILDYLERSVLIECGLVKFFVTGQQSVVEGNLTLETFQSAFVDATVNYHRLIGHSARRDEIVEASMPPYETRGFARLASLYVI